jgi:hypothetical protein
MASGSKVTPTLNPDTSPYDESGDDDDDNEAFLHEMGIVYASLRSNNDARAKVEHLMETLLMRGNRDSISSSKSYPKRSILILPYLNLLNLVSLLMLNILLMLVLLTLLLVKHLY